MSPRRAVALLAAGLLALAACSTGSSDSVAAPDGTTRAATSLHWGRCGNVECATLRVPLDRSLPHGKQIGLALARVKAAKRSERIGSLVVNPGGPGAPGADFVDQLASSLPKAITDRFDIVGWDPRGTGRSSPVDCGNRLDYLFRPDAAPDNAAEYAARDAAARRFAQSCNLRSPDLIRHIATADTVQDLDRIRAAVGDKKLTFLGLSYGSYIGALYAQRYPGQVRALVLDGAIDPALSIDDVSIEQSKGFEQSLAAFLADCAQNTHCAFHHGGKPRTALDALRARIDQHPMRGDDGQVLGPTQFDVAVSAPLYEGADGYGDLAESLHRTERGDPSAMLANFDDYVGRKSNGTYSPEWAAFLAISCADGPSLAPAAVPSLEAHARSAAPMFGVSSIGLTLACEYWAVAPVNRVPTAVSAPGAPPIVVVGTTGDPATPVAWAAGLAHELGPESRLVTVDGTSHTSTMSGSPCLDDAMDAYLVRLRPPARGLRCPA